MLRVNAGQLGEAVKAEVVQRLADARLDITLVSQAKQRFISKGDSQYAWPDLWVNKVRLTESIRYGGDPLRDTGQLFNSMDSRSEVDGDTVSLFLTSPLAYAKDHQEGFVNPGPIAVPLTAKAKRAIPPRSPHDIEALEARGLKRAPSGAKSLKGFDFIVLEGDHWVPPRRMFNPKDPAANAQILEQARLAIKG